MFSIFLLVAMMNGDNPRFFTAKEFPDLPSCTKMLPLIAKDLGDSAQYVSLQCISIPKTPKPPTKAK